MGLAVKSLGDQAVLNVVGGLVRSAGRSSRGRGRHAMQLEVAVREQERPGTHVGGLFLSPHELGVGGVLGEFGLHLCGRDRVKLLQAHDGGVGAPALGASLFELIGLTFVRDLITERSFAFLASAAIFAVAVHITDTRMSLVIGARTIALILLSWLLPLLALFAWAFFFSLFFTGLAPLWATGSATESRAARYRANAAASPHGES